MLFSSGRFIIFTLLYCTFCYSALLSQVGGPLTGSGGGIIAFISDRDGSHEIYLMNADGSAQTRVTNNSAFEFNVDWSPDGHRLAFISSMHSGFELYVMDVIDITNATFSSPLRLTNNSVMDMSPTWSPDGSKIAYFSSGTGIIIMNIDGSNSVVLNTTPVIASQPSWSPIEDIIAFSGQVGSNFNIYSINTNSTNMQQITNHNYDLVPELSPDGTEIAYVNTNNFTEDVYIINSNGSNDRRITISPENDFVPSWSPEGDRLVYEGSVNGNDQICIIDTSGANYQQLTYAGTNTGPSWRPMPGTNDIPDINSNKILPKEFILFQNYPNPFNSTTTIKYKLNRSGHVKLNVYNTLGKKIVSLVDNYQTKGDYQYQWKAPNLPSDVYFIQLQFDKLMKVCKAIYLK